MFIAIIVVAFGLFGMLYDFTGAVLLVVSSGLLIYVAKKKKGIKIRLSVGLLWAAALALCYLISAIYAIDSGMAIMGVVRYLWIVPAVVCYQNLSEDERDRVISALPWIGCAMVLLGGVGYFIQATKEILYTAGRFGGMFNYANTQAVFLLLCIIALCDRKELRALDIIRYVILLAGIGLTGSRIVMVLTILCLLYMLIRNRNKYFIVTTVVLGVLAVIIVAVAGDISAIGRITQLSLKESTLLGRILYAQDAAPLLLKHPFGMGYLGYYYIQNSIQTGWYSVMYVHNDLLQIGLDVGIIPMLAYLAAIVWAVLSRKLSITKKVMVLALFLHGLMDFDMVYSIMMLLMCMLLDDIDIAPARDKSVGQLGIVSAAGVFIIAGLYFCIPTVADFAENNRLANDTYPWHTQAKLALMSESEDVDEVDRLSKEILKQNKTCALAYYAKAMVADCNGDYDSMIEYGKKAIQMDYFNIDEYENYAILLYDGLMSGDESTYDKCAAEVFKIPEYMEDAMARLSKRGKMIKDQPELELTDTMQQLMEALQ